MAKVYNYYIKLEKSEISENWGYSYVYVLLELFFKYYLYVVLGTYNHPTEPYKLLPEEVKTPAFVEIFKAVPNYKLPTPSTYKYKI